MPRLAPDVNPEAGQRHRAGGRQVVSRCVQPPRSSWALLERPEGWRAADPLPQRHPYGQTRGLDGAAILACLELRTRRVTQALVLAARAEISDLHLRSD